jgi:hypothetical protein
MVTSDQTVTAGRRKCGQDDCAGWLDWQPPEPDDSHHRLCDVTPPAPAHLYLWTGRHRGWQHMENQG